MDYTCCVLQGLCFCHSVRHITLQTVAYYGAMVVLEQKTNCYYKQVKLNRAILVYFQTVYFQGNQRCKKMKLDKVETSCTIHQQHKLTLILLSQKDVFLKKKKSYL